MRPANDDLFDSTIEEISNLLDINVENKARFVIAQDSPLNRRIVSSAPDEDFESTVANLKLKHFPKNTATSAYHHDLKITPSSKGKKI